MDDFKDDFSDADEDVEIQDKPEDKPEDKDLDDKVNLELDAVGWSQIFFSMQNLERTHTC